MSKKIKQFMQQELAERYGEVSECVVVTLHGVTGNENNELRGDLKNREIRLNVVKNSLARRAFEAQGQSVADLFSGPCAVAFGGDSIVDVAKVMVEWAKKISKLEVKGAYLEGQVLGAEQATELSKMPSRQELQGQVTAAAMGPGARLAGAVVGPAGRIAGCIEALVKRMEEAA